MSFPVDEIDRRSMKKRMQTLRKFETLHDAIASGKVAVEFVKCRENADPMHGAFARGVFEAGEYVAMWNGVFVENVTKEKEEKLANLCDVSRYWLAYGKYVCCPRLKSDGKPLTPSEWNENTPIHDKSIAVFLNEPDKEKRTVINYDGGEKTVTYVEDGASRPNVCLKYDRRTRAVFMYALERIEPGTELVWYYGSQYADRGYEIPELKTSDTVCPAYTEKVLVKQDVAFQDFDANMFVLDAMWPAQIQDDRLRQCSNQPRPRIENVPEDDEAALNAMKEAYRSARKQIDAKWQELYAVRMSLLNPRTYRAEKMASLIPAMETIISRFDSELLVKFDRFRDLAEEDHDLWSLIMRMQFMFLNRVRTFVLDTVKRQVSEQVLHKTFSPDYYAGIFRTHGNTEQDSRRTWLDEDFVSAFPRASEYAQRFFEAIDGVKTIPAQLYEEDAPPPTKRAKTAAT